MPVHQDNRHQSEYREVYPVFRQVQDVRIKYFVPDKHKSGEAIVEASGQVKKISATDGTIVMACGYKIKASNITNLSILSVE